MNKMGQSRQHSPHTDPSFLTVQYLQKISEYILTYYERVGVKFQNFIMVMKSIGTQTDKKVGKKSAEKGHVNLPTDPNEHNAVSEVEEQSAKTGPVYSCGFEVFGIVQGVSFRMYTLRRAQKLSVRGWCMNTSQNTVKGEIEGYLHSFESMRLWLKHTGSPTSRIDKCVFTDITEHTSFKFSNFSILLE